MSIMKKKIKANKENSLQKESSEVEDNQELDSQHLVLMNQLSHPAEMGYQILLKLQLIIQTIQEQNLILQKRNDIIEKQLFEEGEEAEEELKSSLST